MTAFRLTPPEGSDARLIDATVTTVVAAADALMCAVGVMLTAHGRPVQQVDDPVLRSYCLAAVNQVTRLTEEQGARP